MGAEKLKGIKQEEDQVEECDEGNLEKILDVTIEDVERLRHTLTPIEDAYNAPVTDLILDELLEEFRDELLDVIVVYEEVDCNLLRI
nr:hypothetical protein [Tanacetum cinerariifolium]